MKGLEVEVRSHVWGRGWAADLSSDRRTLWLLAR